MSNLTEIRVPDIGDFEGIEVIGILVDAGDVIEADQALIELESDKATMEVPSPQAGKVAELKLSVGDKVSEGDLILMLEATADQSESEAEAEQPETEDTEIESEPAPEREPEPASSEPPAVADTSGTATDAGTRREATPPVSYDASAIKLDDRLPNASPSVRKLARELGVPLTEVTGTGRKGRITAEDIKGFVKQVMHRKGSGQAAESGTTGLSLLDWPSVDFSKFGEIEVEPLSRIKKISGANLSRNWVMIPHVTQHDEADVTELEAFRKAHKDQAREKGIALTPLAFLIKACVGALKEFPAFNASLDASGESLVLKKYFNIGVAVDTPDGLVVPVLRDCDRKSVYELAAELGDVSARARDRKLTPTDMSGGCFSISSLGGIGGTAFTPIINAPEVAILGVSRHARKPVWNGSEFEPRLVLPLSLSYDHRVIDGASAARFTGYLSWMISDVRRLLL